jgi:hypothetical protein
MKSKEDYEAFREGLTALLDGATEIDDGRLRKSESVFHDPEQGVMTFDERRYNLQPQR